MDIPKSIVGERRTYAELAHTHHHIFAQLILPLQGSLFIENPLHDFELDDSRLFFLPPKCQHTFYAKSNNEFLVLDIPNFMLVDEQTRKIQGGLSTVLDDRWQGEWFKKLTGVTPKAYIQNLRLQKAKELLAETDQSIFQIAQQVGYEHHSSLTRLFQQYENLTPLAYRQQTRRLEKRDQKFG